MSILDHISYFIFVCMGIFSLYIFMKTRDLVFLISGLGMLAVMIASYIEVIKNERRTSVKTS